VSTESLLLTAAVKATLLVGAALISLVFAARMSAAVRHAILLAALAGALLLPVLGATLPTFSPIPIPSHFPTGNPDLRRLADRVTLFLLVRSDPGSVLPVRSGRPETSGAVILTVWLLGSAISLFRIGADLAAAARLLSRASPRGYCAPGVPLLESAEISGPVTVGLFRPAVVIPATGVGDTQSLRLVIAHEMAHVERRDCLTQLIVRLACAAYWFNPLFWCAANRIGLERERACDDRVLAAGVDPVGYSRLLVKVARRQGRSVPRHALTSMAQAAWLEQRIVGILDAAATRGSLSRRSSMALVAAAGFLVAPLAAFGLHDRPSPRAAQDPWYDSQSERVPGFREFDESVSSGIPGTADGALKALLREAAARESLTPFDLVPDRARWALSLAGESQLIGPLMNALGDPDWRVRGYAAWALGYSGDPRAVDPLIALLDHPVWRLRAMAAAALQRIGDPRAASAMTEALEDTAWQVRVEAVAYLGALGESGHRRRIEPLRDDTHIAVRFAADEALSAMP
jgi:beta-lactamase regulating signal transducer with metallopeptidase domain